MIVNDSGPRQYARGTVAGNVYTVEIGDNLNRIAQRFGVNMFTLANLNGIANINRIYAFQTLIIPAG